MPRETSRPGTGDRILPQLSKCIPKSINSTPPTDYHIRAPGITQMGHQEHLTWNHLGPPKDHFLHPKLTLIHNTAHHGPHLAHHPVSHQYFIHTRYLDYKLPNTTNGHVNYGRMQTHE